MNKMLQMIRKNVESFEEVPVFKAVLFIAIVPLTILMDNTHFTDNSYVDVLIDYVVFTIYPLVVGRRSLFLKPILSTKKTLVISGAVLVISLAFSAVGLIILGSSSSTRLVGGIANINEYVQYNSLLPLIGLSEEFFCVLAFIGLFSLLTGDRLKKFLLSVIVVPLFFGLMHSFDRSLAVILTMGLGHIPYIFSTIYFRSVLPAIIAHIAWDGVVFFQDFNKNIFTLIWMSLLTLCFVYYNFVKKKTLTD